MKRTFSAFGWMFLAGIALFSSCSTEDKDLFPDNTDKTETKITLKMNVLQDNQVKNIAFLGTYFSVNWGDGIDQNYTAPNQEKTIPHAYSKAGEYTVIITGTNITKLDIADENVSQLTIEKAPSLRQLDCKQNQLTALNLQNADSILKVFCSSNVLTSINVAGLKKLQTINCGANNLSTLSMSGCSALTEFQTESNPLVSLDMSNCDSLRILSVKRPNNNSLAKLETLTLKGCSSLLFLSCERNNLSKLDVSDCKKLSTLICFSNRLSSIKLTNPTNLRTLKCYYNQLTTEELTNIVNALPTITGEENAYTCLIAEKSLEDTPDETNGALSEEAISTLTSKNWTLTNQWN